MSVWMTWLFLGGLGGLIFAGIKLLMTSRVKAAQREGANSVIIEVTKKEIEDVSKGAAVVLTRVDTPEVVDTLKKGGF